MRYIIKLFIWDFFSHFLKWRYSQLWTSPLDLSSVHPKGSCRLYFHLHFNLWIKFFPNFFSDPLIIQRYIILTRDVSQWWSTCTTWMKTWVQFLELHSKNVLFIPHVFVYLFFFNTKMFYLCLCVCTDVFPSCVKMSVEVKRCQIPRNWSYSHLM